MIIDINIVMIIYIYLIRHTHFIHCYIRNRNIYKEQPCDSVMGTELKQAV